MFKRILPWLRMFRLDSKAQQKELDEAIVVLESWPLYERLLSVAERIDDNRSLTDVSDISDLRDALKAIEEGKDV